MFSPAVPGSTALSVPLARPGLEVAPLNRLRLYGIEGAGQHGPHLRLVLGGNLENQQWFL
jgi:hypothetical protein